MACSARARILGRRVEVDPAAVACLTRPPRGALRAALVALAALVAVPQGACAAKDYVAASMGVPVEPFTMGQLIELKGAVENGASAKAAAIMAEAGLGDLGPVWDVATR